MEVVRERPPEGERHHTAEYARLVVAEVAPHPLLHAAHAIQAGSRGGHRPIEHFPVLDAVRGTSARYVDEDLWLAPSEVAGLLAEFTRLRGVCREEEFVPGLEGRAVAAAWRGTVAVSSAFEPWLDAIEALLRRASAGGCWVRLML
jgi:hypothetical protein